MPLKSAMTSHIETDLKCFGDGMCENDCLDVRMGSIGQCWIPVFDIWKGQDVRFVMTCLIGYFKLFTHRNPRCPLPTYFSTDTGTL